MAVPYVAMGVVCARCGLLRSVCFVLASENVCAPCVERAAQRVGAAEPPHRRSRMAFGRNWSRPPARR